MGWPDRIAAGGLRSLEGRGTSPGEALGPLVRLRPGLEPREAIGSILVTERVSPHDVEVICAAAGVLTLSGALYSHASLLAREFRKPAVALRPGTAARVVEPNDGGHLLEFPEHGPDARLREGDVVILEGDVGRVRVPAGFGLSAAQRVREAWNAVRNGSADVPADLLPFAIEAAVRFRCIPSGTPAAAWVGAVRDRHGDVARTAFARFARQVEDDLERFSVRAQAEIRGVEEPDELERRAGRARRQVSKAIEALVDAGFDPGSVREHGARIEAAARDRRIVLRDVVQREAEALLDLPHDLAGARVGAFHGALRRAVAVGIGDPWASRLRERLSRHVAEERRRLGQDLVVPLTADHAPGDRDLVGGKAAGLLAALPLLPPGARVPRGFVLTSTAYRLHLLAETGEGVREAARAADHAAVSRRARAAILAGPIPDEVRDAVLRCVSDLGVRCLAVRSSATVEDSPAGALAGQFDTFLGIRDAAGVLDRLRWAWASLWNARALAALAAGGRSPLAAAQAVLVQEFVETRAAGVLVTRDPDGSPETLMVNAAWGLGEGISQGEVAGDLYRVRRDTGTLVEHRPSGDRRMIVLDPRGPGTVDRPLPDAARHRAVLDDDELRRLAELARVIEAATGRAQDLEFGFAADGTLLVFQVRRLVGGRG